MASYSDENIHICGLEEPDVLTLDTVLYYGFGGYTVYKNDQVFYEGNSKMEWKDFKTLGDIEFDASKDPNSKWTVVLNNPLEGATWARVKKTGEWLAIEKNRGFA